MVSRVGSVVSADGRAYCLTGLDKWAAGSPWSAYLQRKKMSLHLVFNPQFSTCSINLEATANTYKHMPWGWIRQAPWLCLSQANVSFGHESPSIRLGHENNAGQEMSRTAFNVLFIDTWNTAMETLKGTDDIYKDRMCGDIHRNDSFCKFWVIECRVTVTRYIYVLNTNNSFRPRWF